MRLRHLECRSAQVKSDAVTTRRDFMKLGALGLGAGLALARSRRRAAADRRLPRRRPAAHLPLLLGDDQSGKRAGARPLADPVLRQHGRGRLRADRLADRRRAALRDPRRGGGADARHPALPRRRAAGRRARRHDRAQGLLLPFRRHGDAAPASRRPSFPPSIPRLLLGGILFCQGYFDRPDELRDPRARRAHLCAGRLALDAGAAATGRARLGSGERLPAL